MKIRSYSFLAWILFVLVTTVLFVNLAFVLSNRPAEDNFFRMVNDVLLGIVPVAFAFLSAVIVTRRPGNVIGWLMMCPPLAFVIDLAGQSYLAQFPTAPAEPTIPLLLASWSSNVSWILQVFPLLFIMLTFPDGRPPSPRWRWVAMAGVILIAFFAFFVLFSPVTGLLDDTAWKIRNPISFLPEDFEFPFVAWGIALLFLVLACVTAPLVRYRRAAGIEREQIKWLFFASGLVLLAGIPGFFNELESYPLLRDALDVLFGLSVLGIAAAITIAITRYRLWEIDIIIRKTLAYTLLTALLAIVYLGCVIILQGLFETITGQRSPVAIVISTLLIAVLFGRLRSSIQRIIDRRFFRQKYDAQQVLAQFAITARDEVDLETLTVELERIVTETMQPQSIHVWLRNKAHKNPGR